MAKIPTTVITGFLGAGKTTLVRRLLDQANGRRIAVIVNEFGDLGVDGALLRAGCGEDDLIELANGCICCTVADDFLPAMSRLIDRPQPPDHILIETSGLALPKPLIKAFAWPQVRTRATVDGVVCMVDADAVAAGRFGGDGAATSHETPLAELFADQLACADLVLLSKSDLVDGDGLAAAQAAVRAAARPGTPVVGVAHGHLDPAVLIGLGAAAEDDLAARPALHDGEEDDHGHDAFESFAITGGEAADADRLIAMISRLLAAHDILRLKGTCAVAGSPARLVVQALGPRLQTYYDRPWRVDEPRGSSLVVIGEAGVDRMGIEAALAEALA